MSENEKLLPQIKVAEPEPSDDTPWNGEILGRKACADKLTAVIQGQIAPMTISVNGEWGSGKTFMLKRWQKQLTKEGYKAIYFNAWEDDFLADPLVAIVGQLYKELNQGTLKDLCEAVKNAAIPFLKRVGLSMLNKGVERVTGVDMAGIVEDEIKTGQESVLDTYVTMTKSRETLKQALQALADKCYETSGQPLVFIVDELDRCRPTFAIELLERIKHLFNIDHRVFMLGIDRVNLGKSVQSVYGDIDVENYLHRFFDFDFRLPPAPYRNFVQVLWKKYSISESIIKMDDRLHREPIFPHGDDEFKTEAVVLFTLHQFSLREIEHSIKTLSLFIKIAQNRADLLHLVPILSVLKLKNPSLYVRYIDARCSVLDVIDYLFYSHCLPVDENLHPSEIPDTDEAMVLMPSIILATISRGDPVYEVVSGLNERVGMGGKVMSGLPEQLTESRYLGSLSDNQQKRIILETCYLLSKNRNYDIFGLHFVHEQLNVFSFRPAL